MGHAHHEHDHAVELHDDLTSAKTERLLWVAVIACAVVTLIGLIVLWPRGDVTTSIDTADLFGTRVDAVVTSTELAPCSYDPIASCHQVTFQLVSGPNKGDTSQWEISFDAVFQDFSSGDDIYVYETTAADGSVSYQFAEYRRDTPLLLLTLIFVVAVIALAGWKGVGAIGGLIASLLVIVVFMLPSLLRGNDAVALALVTASVIAFVALYLAHGINIATTVALLSTFASLTLIGLLAWIFVRTSNFTGFTEDSSFLLSSLGVQIDARGLLLAGIVIGSLGVLDDVTVTQVSAVWELRQLQPLAPRRDIYLSAINIGRDHISSTVNTLFLTYAGAALPLLLLFTVTGQGVGTVATGEIVAIEIVRALVGSIGLIASVPIATWLATSVLTPPRSTAEMVGNRVGSRDD